MFTLVTGGSGSGKSEYAEALAAGCSCKNRWYLATMEVFGEEGRRKVDRHRRQREGKGFATLECPRGLKNLRIPGDPGDTAVLLECVSNLAANEMFGAGEALGEGTGAARAEREVLEGILSLADKARELVVVTNEVGSDGVEYETETQEYIRLMGRINCRLAERADRVVEVVFGIPVLLAGAALEKNSDCAAEGGGLG